jgi:hypothetical protein
LTVCLAVIGSSVIASTSGCASPATPRACAEDSHCPAQSRCLEGGCLGNRPPVAAIDAPASVEAFALVTLDGSGSSDVDPGDAPVAHAWSISAVEATCEAPTVASTTPAASVRFACPGRYRVELAVRDGLGATSAPATHEVTVTPGTSAVTAAGDLVIGHRCAGAPLLCRAPAEGRVGLAVSSTLGPDSLTYAWRVIPPADRPTLPARRVLLETSGPAATVHVETDGVAISGDWLFEVTARDAVGVVGVATQRLSVTNAPPVITLDVAPSYPHAFSDVDRAFAVRGSIPWTVSDPEGGPIVSPSVGVRTSSELESFSGASDGAAISFFLEVSYDLPEAAELLRGPGVTRTIQVFATDVNGATSSREAPIVIGNRPPRFVAGPTEVSVPHSFDRATSRYLANATVGTWIDDDGDPLRQEGPTGSDVCAQLTFGKTVRVRCGQDYVGVPDLAGFAARHRLLVQVRDPWEVAPGRAVDVVIENRAPTLDLSILASTMTRATSSLCCVTSNFICVSYAPSYSPGTVTATGRHTDPDGDPIDITLGTERTTCASSGCSLSTALDGFGPRCVGGPTISLTANDGLSLVSGNAPLNYLR